MSLFSKSSLQKSDVTVVQDGSSEIFSAYRESSVETGHSINETLSSSTANDEHEASSAKSERILKRKSLVFRVCLCHIKDQKKSLLLAQTLTPNKMYLR